VSKERDRPHYVNLFLIEGPEGIHHYVWVNNLSRLVSGRIKESHAAFVCNHCLYPFCKKEIHDRHVLNCQRHAPQDLKYPNPENPKERTLKFHNKAARFRLPFYLVCDFESFLTPGEDVDAVKATNIYEHNICGFACHRVSQYPEYQSKPLVYSGPGVMDKFYDHIMRESEIISDILANNRDMTTLTATQQRDYQDATQCAECGGTFTKSNHKVRHHDHVTGQYLFPACNSCNHTLKMPNRKRKVTQGQVQNKKAKIDEDMEWAENKYGKNFFIPVVFHNLKSYDAHLVIKHFKKQYTARCRDLDDDDDSPMLTSRDPAEWRKVSVIPGWKSTFPVPLNILGQPRVAAFEKWS